MKKSEKCRQKPKFSIIIPVYNTEEYISQCLTSILKQSFTDFEIICINDGSTDKSGETLESFAAINNKIIVKNQKQMGVSASRNSALEVATGEYCLFVDSDDYLHPDALEILNKHCEEQNPDIICFEFKKTNKRYDELIFDEFDSDKIKPVLMDSYEYLAQNESVKAVWSKAIRTSIAKKISFPIGYVYGEDAYYTTLILSSLSKILYLDVPLYCYYKRDGSATNRNYNIKMFQIVDLYEELAKLFLSRKDTDWAAHALDMLYHNIFSGRFLSYLTKEYKEINTVAKRIGSRNIKLLIRSSLSSKSKIMTLVFFYFPQLYRFIRIKLDPTLKGFERLKRERNQLQK